MHIQSNHDDVEELLKALNFLEVRNLMLGFQASIGSYVTEPPMNSFIEKVARKKRMAEPIALDRNAISWIELECATRLTRQLRVPPENLSFPVRLNWRPRSQHAICTIEAMIRDPFLCTVSNALRALRNAPITDQSIIILMRLNQNDPFGMGIMQHSTVAAPSAVEP